MGMKVKTCFATAKNRFVVAIILKIKTQTDVEECSKYVGSHLHQVLTTGQVAMTTEIWLTASEDTKSGPSCPFYTKLVLVESAYDLSLTTIIFFTLENPS